MNRAQIRIDIGDNLRSFFEGERTADVQEAADLQDGLIDTDTDPLLAVEIDHDRLTAGFN